MTTKQIPADKAIYMAIDLETAGLQHDFSHKKHLASRLPESCGIYLMKNERGDILYVGKAKNLSKRVRSYFYAGPKNNRQLSLLAEIKSIDHITTGTEIGALLLESELIYKLKPAYNVLGKDYHRYPFIQVDYSEDFPTPKIVHEVNDEGFYCGPFPNTADLEILLEVAKDLYGLKQCDYKIKAGRRRRPCLYYQINRCSGPCSGIISQEEYRTRLMIVMDVFDGHSETLQWELIKRRDKAADKLHFEKAALYNRSLDSLQKTASILEGLKNAKANLGFISRSWL